MAITHEKAIRELDEIRKNPNAPVKEKAPEKAPRNSGEKQGNENNVPDPAGPHPPMYS